jgi:Tfp pilus assembly protein PilO
VNKNKLSLVIALVVTVAVLAGGWFLGVQPLLAQSADNDRQQESIDSANDANQAELVRLAKAAGDLGATKAELAALRASIPSTVDTTPFLKALDAHASAAGVVITTITIGDAQPYVGPTVADGSGSAPAAATPAPSAAATPAPSAAATPAVPTAPVPVTDSAITGTNFTVMPVTVAIAGSYDQALAFTKAVQGGDRLFLVNRIAATDADESAPPMTSQAWSLSGFVYVLAEPSDAAETAPATDPVESPTASPTATPAG